MSYLLVNLLSVLMGLLSKKEVLRDTRGPRLVLLTPGRTSSWVSVTPPVSLLVALSRKEGFRARLADALLPRPLTSAMSGWSASEEVRSARLATDLVCILIFERGKLSRKKKYFCVFFSFLYFFSKNKDKKYRHFTRSLIFVPKSPRMYTNLLIFLVT